MKGKGASESLVGVTPSAIEGRLIRTASDSSACAIRKYEEKKGMRGERIIEKREREWEERGRTRGEEHGKLR